jgi:hypothetical protein
MERPDQQPLHYTTGPARPFPEQSWTEFASRRSVFPVLQPQILGCLLVMLAEVENLRDDQWAAR